MKILLLPLLLAVLVSPWLPTAAAAGDCPKECGGVNITYPFGVGQDCYLKMEGSSSQQPFNVTCSDLAADGSPLRKPTPIIDGTEVLDIDVLNGKIHVKSPVNSFCYNTSTHTMNDYQDTWSFKEGLAAFHVSDTDNKLTVVGCNVLAFFWSRDGGDDDKYMVACNATCSSGGVRSLPTNGSCSDVGGCCQAPIRPGTSFNVNFVNDYDNSSDGHIPGFGPASLCGYAMVVEANEFKFKTTYITTDELGSDRVQMPLVLDWSLDNKTCAHACRGANAKCVPSKNGAPGFLCNCTQGYEGDPYHPDGCKDIDECKILNRPCSADIICLNTVGSYHCIGLKLLLGIVGVCLVVLLGTGMCCTYAIRQKKRLAAIKRLHFKQHGGFLLFEEMKSRQSQGHSFTLFTKEELDDATNKFDERYILGKGGNGTVYYGKLKDGRAVAIKRCRLADDERQQREFGKEMLILSQVNHRNIVKLYGCCLEVEVPMLVYQFIPNGTLYQLIHRDGAPPPLAVRLKIAHETAEALAYLHSMASPPIIHGDVKSPNILLDENYTVKVSDFGSSVLAPIDNAHIVTLVQGTRGYLDPEYMQTCRLTDKSDVYSFGVVLLELLTRRKALTMAAPEEERSLAAYFLSSMRDGKLDGLLDVWIRDEVKVDVTNMVATLAKKCLDMSSENRPSMCEVAEELDTIRKMCGNMCFDEITHSSVLIY